nr:mating-type protein HD1.1 [Hypsizygus marmoreus]
MDADLEAQFVQRISRLEDDFLDPFLDQASFVDFHGQWISLADAIQSPLDAGLLSMSTVSMLHDLADNISAVAQSFLDLEELSDSLMSSLVLEASSIITPPTTPPIDSARGQPLNSSTPPYITPSYMWLLDNIHDPYPPVAVREGIARETASSRKDIDGWFIDARKRMGWTTLRKVAFSNRRIDIVDAATRFFVRDDPKRPVDPNLELEFASIEKRAKDLYSDKFSESDLAAKLDMAVKNLTPEMKAKAKAEERRRMQFQMDDISAISSYPSPERSPEPTRLSPVPYEDESDALVSQSISILSRKRRSPSADPPEWNQNMSSDRPNKRTRLDHTISTSVIPFPTGLPSPASSVDEPLRTTNEHATPAASTPESTPRLNRKRRLSDADGQGAPKRPHNLPVGPRVQAVSDPLPLSSALFDASAFDGWFNQQFDIPAFSVVDQPEPSLQFDVEFGDISTFTSTLTPLSSRYASPQAEDMNSTLSTEEIVWNSTEIPSFELPTHDFNFEEFQSWLSDDASHQPSVHVVTPQPQDILAQMPSLGNDLSLKGFNDSFSLTAPPMQPPEPFILDPIPNFSWELSDYINMPSQSQSVFPDMFQSILGVDSQDNVGFNPTAVNVFDTSYLVPSADSMAQTERAEKERKLFEMKEAARRLEEELAAS